ncbi:hypothetical protein C8J56DRAFT_539387 [Mycena floridula]|nr:hypothetical protein C8J56DRAFT_539387 [Mycena floridula]
MPLALFDEVQGFLPSLRWLCISMLDVQGKTSAFLTAPNLATVLVRRPQLMRNLAPATITEISTIMWTSQISPQDLFVLSGFRALTRCSFAFNYSNRALNFTLAMPHLTILSLKTDGLGDPITQFLNVLTAPSLKSLNLEGSMISTDGILSCKDRSQFNLDTLNLSSRRFGASCFQLLEKLPTLRNLSLACSNAYTELFFQQLQSHAVLPVLESMVVAGELKDRDASALVLLMTARPNVQVRHKVIGS